MIHFLFYFSYSCKHGFGQPTGYNSEHETLETYRHINDIPWTECSDSSVDLTATVGHMGKHMVIKYWQKYIKMTMKSTQKKQIGK